WNVLTRPAPVLRHKIEVLKDHCQAVGRDYTTLRKTYYLPVFLAKTTAEAERLAAPIAARVWGEAHPPFVGDAAALREYILEVAELGFDLFQLQFPRFPDTNDIAIFA